MDSRRLLLLAPVPLLLAVPALAAPCRGDFNAFLAAIARDARGQGVSRAVINQAFAGLTPDSAVLAFDRRQRGMFYAKTLISSFCEIAQRLRCKRCCWPKSTKPLSRGRITNEIISDKQVSVTPNKEVDRSGGKDLASLGRKAAKALQRATGISF